MANKSQVVTAKVDDGNKLSARATKPPKSAFCRPPWLRRTVLLAFVALFLILCVGLVLLWHFVNRNDGIPLSLTTNHYAWTYGPTAILVVIVGLWRQVNYCSMTNQPWQELQRGPKPAAQTVLLDYMWPLQISSFIKALKNRHLAVATTIFVFALLKIIIVISTTLFVPADSSLSQPVEVTLLTKFDPAHFWETTPPAAIIISNNEESLVYPLGNSFGDTTFENVSADPVWGYMNLRNQYADSSFPVHLSTAFSNFSIVSEVPGNAYQASADVDVFDANATCEVATVGWSQDEQANTFNLTLNTPSCNIGRVEVPACSPSSDGVCPSTGRLFMVERVNCTGDGTHLFGGVYVDDKTINTYQYAIIAVESDLSTRSTSDNNVTVLYEAVVQRVAAVSCSLTYSMHRGIAQSPGLDTSRIDSLDIVEGPAGDIANFTNLQFSEAVMSTLQSAYTIFDNDALVMNTMGACALFGLMSDSTTATTLDPFLDAPTLKTATQQVLYGVSQQLMRRYFLLPDDTPASGFVEYSERRLYIRPAALWTMVGLFAFMSCLVIIVIVYTKQRVAPRSPATLATGAFTLARSPAMAELLHHCGAKRLSQIRKDLVNYDFVATQDRARRPCIEALEVIREEKPPKPPGWISRKWQSIKPKRKKQSTKVKKPKTKREWMPWSARRHAIGLTLLLPLIAIAALEILWHYAESNDNFVTVPSDSSAAAYAVRYGSTVTVLIMATLFNTLDFAIATMTPFSALRAGNAPAERTVLFSIVGDLPPVAFYKTIRHVHVGAALSLAASTIGSLLTIITSGLWFMNTSIVISQSATASIESGWTIDFEARNITGSTAAALFNAIQHGSVDNATLIWDNVVLPVIGNAELSDSGSALQTTIGSDSLQYNLAVPSLQPVLECSVLPSSAILVNQTRVDGAGPLGRTAVWNNFGATAPLPAGCISSSPLDEPDTITFSSELDLNRVGPPEDPNWIGFLYDLSVSPSNPPPENADGCPSLGAIFGTYGDDPGLERTITAVVCTQRLQQVEANVTYSSTDPSILTPNFTAPVHLSPVPATTLLDPRSGVSSLSYATRAAFGNFTTSFTERPRSRIDTFFNQLTTGPGGTSHEDLLGPSNTATLTAAMNTLYQKFMVRVIDLDYRSSTNTDTPETSAASLPIPDDGIVEGTTTLTTSRLKMSRVSKIILEALLGAMVLLGGLAYWLVDMRGTLPRNPYPVASGMAWFAGSRLLGKTSGDGNGNGNGNGVGGGREMVVKRKPVVVVRGKVFGLGWWDLGDGDGSGSGNGNEDAHVQEVGGQDGGRLQTAARGGGGERASRGDVADADAYPNGDTTAPAPAATTTPTPTPAPAPTTAAAAATFSQAQPQSHPQAQSHPQNQDQDQDQNQNQNQALTKGKRFGIDVANATTANAAGAAAAAADKLGYSEKGGWRRRRLRLRLRLPWGLSAKLIRKR